MDRSHVPKRCSPRNRYQTVRKAYNESDWPDPAPSVHSLILKHTNRTLRKHGRGIPQHVENTLLRMHYCRTPVLGTRQYRCVPCNYEKTVYNSCGDRNCPNCSGAKRRDWLDKTRELVAPGVTYFQVIFTLPEELSSLALGNRKEMYDLLFQVAWRCLSRKIEKELGIRSAGQAVLHTWNQRLGHHPHVHLAVPGNGPSLDGTRWVACKTTKDGQPFLVDNKELSAEFRKEFLSELEILISKNKIRIEEPGYIAEVLNDLAERNWNVFIERPPKPDMPAERMFKYLARYMTGGPISDLRILGEKDGRIWFLARSLRKGEGQIATSLESVEFVRSWCMHVLPKEYTKVRTYGAWSCSKRTKYRQDCERLHPATVEESESTRVKTELEKPKTKTAPNCPHCGQCMEVLRCDDRPSWREVILKNDHPGWYKPTDVECEFPPEPKPSWEHAYGSQTKKASEEPDLFDEIIAMRESLAELNTA
ncbi:IS91 family transposase [Pirellulaceae bacterium SH449]